MYPQTLAQPFLALYRGPLNYRHWLRIGYFGATIVVSTLSLTTLPLSYYKLYAATQSFQTDAATDSSQATLQAAVAAINPQPDTLATATEKARLKLVNAKLAKIIADFDQAHFGIYGIRVFSLDHKIDAAHLANRVFVTASTYKPFLAYAVYYRAEHNRLNLDSYLTNGYSTIECMRLMIVYSDNTCAIALQKRVGIKTAEALVLAAGFRQTNINNYNAYGQLITDKISTPADEAKFLERLTEVKLLNNADTKQLLGWMKVQIFRDGIPAGVPKTVSVADKVGFLDEWQHDEAIVYGRKLTFILVGMSEGGSRPAMASLSRQIYQLLNP